MRAILLEETMKITAILLAALAVASCDSPSPSEPTLCHYSFERVSVAIDFQRILYLDPIRANPANSCYLMYIEDGVETWECRICNENPPQ